MRFTPIKEGVVVNQFEMTLKEALTLPKQGLTKRKTILLSINYESSVALL